MRDLWAFIVAAFNAFVGFFTGRMVEQYQNTAKEAQDELDDYKLAKRLDEANRALSDEQLDSKLRSPPQ